MQQRKIHADIFKHAKSKKNEPATLKDKKKYANILKVNQIHTTSQNIVRNGDPYLRARNSSAIFPSMLPNSSLIENKSIHPYLRSTTPVFPPKTPPYSTPAISIKKTICQKKHLLITKSR